MLFVVALGLGQQHELRCEARISCLSLSLFPSHLGTAVVTDLTEISVDGVVVARGA
jgi:hypothetical protein